MRVWAVDSKKSLQQKKDFGAVAGLKFAPGGSDLVLLREGTLERWNATSGEQVDTVKIPFDAAIVGFSNNRQHAVVAKENARTSADVHVIALGE